MADLTEIPNIPSVLFYIRISLRSAINVNGRETRSVTIYIVGVQIRLGELRRIEYIKQMVLFPNKVSSLLFNAIWFRLGFITSAIFFHWNISKPHG